MKSDKRLTGYLIASVSFVVTVLLILGVIFVGQAQQTLYQEKVNYLQEISLKNAKNIESQISGYFSTLEAISTFIGNYDTPDIFQAMPFLKEESKKNMFKRMGIIAPNGLATTTDGKTWDFSDRDYFKKAMQGKNSISDCLIDKIDGEEINVCSTPIYCNSNIVGVVFATKTQKEFSEMMAMETFGGQGYSYIITSKGAPIVKTKNPNSIGNYTNLFESMRTYHIADESIEKLKTDMAHGANGSFTYLRDHTNRQFCYTKINVNDWYILSAVPSRAISLQSDLLIQKLIVLTVLIFLSTVVASFVTIRNFRKNQETLEHLAYTDTITGYSNWTKFVLDAKNLLTNHPDQTFAMIVFDIKKFKVINDMFGYENGNKALQYVADVLRRNTASLEAFSRTASDNFNILMKYENDETIIHRLTQIINQFSNCIDGYKIEVAVGIYTIDDNQSDISALSDRATISKNIAKKQNDHFYSFFQEKNRLEIIHEKEIENVMENALENHEFEFYLQPKYLLKTDKIVGAEALVRWNRPEMGLVFPNAFIFIFEKNGFIRKLDLYMFEKACLFLVKCQQEFGKAIPLSVNISRVHLSDPKLPQTLLDIAKKHGVDPKLLEIELTESAVFLDVAHMIEMMNQIKAAGFLISIDDFGSGYSSLSALKDLPADFVKIDKSFLDKAVNDKRGEEIISSIVSMTKGLGLFTVAEGVETEKQLHFLKSIGCDIAQGYFYSKAIPTEEFEKLIAEN